MVQTAQPEWVVEDVAEQGRDAILKVSKNADVQRLAGSISEALKRSGSCELQAIGPDATNQAIKAFAVSRGILHSRNQDASLRPTFMDVLLDGKFITALRLTVTLDT